MLRTLLACVVALFLCPPAFAVRPLTDLAACTAKLPDRVERGVIGEARFLIAMGLLEGAALPQRVVREMARSHGLIAVLA